MKALFLILCILGCFSFLQISCSESKPQTNLFEEETLKIKLFKDTVSEESLRLGLNIFNRSTNAVALQNRFLTGYEEDDEGDVYFRIYKENTERYDTEEKHQTSVLPALIKKDDQMNLLPGTSINVWVNFSEFYLLPEPGKYKVVGYYRLKRFNSSTQFFEIKKIFQTDTLLVQIKKK